APRVPLGVARPYASMLLEMRQGQLGLIPTDAFRAGLNPSDGDIQSFYSQNRQRYIVPEQRILRLAKITADAVANAAPNEGGSFFFFYKKQQSNTGARARS